LAENHAGEAEKAEVCKPCYERLQERMDVCEGALHMDLKEAAQIIYDAVWADPSDPSKTYSNAANALLTSLISILRFGLLSSGSPIMPAAGDGCAGLRSVELGSETRGREDILFRLMLTSLSSD
jgi:hypothetical protein